MSFRRGMLRLDIANSLSSCERDIFELLLSAARAKSASTTIRVAGGWVRDKLLGLESDDIDIAVDDCSGVAFAAMVNDHLQSQGQNVERVAVIHVGIRPCITSLFCSSSH
jgi:tRNA nucleotidyltransferase/poly(A) polymerase